MSLAGGVRACVFDAYGTLLDLDTAATPHAAALGDAAAPLLTLWRRKQLEYTWLRTLMGRHADFATVTRDALDYALESLGLTAAGLAPALARSFRELGPRRGPPPRSPGFAPAGSARRCSPTAIRTCCVTR